MQSRVEAIGGVWLASGAQCYGTLLLIFLIPIFQNGNGSRNWGVIWARGGEGGEGL